MKCKKCGVQYPSTASFPKIGICVVCYRQRVLFSVGIPVGVSLVFAAFAFDFHAGIFLGPILAGASARGGLRGAGYAFSAGFIGFIAFLITQAVAEDAFGGELSSIVGASIIMGGLGMGFLSYGLGIIPGIIHKVATKNMPLYLLHNKLRTQQFYSPVLGAIERRLWDEDLKKDIESALNSKEEIDVEWAKTELDYYVKSGVTDAIALAQKYDINLKKDVPNVERC